MLRFVPLFFHIFIRFKQICSKISFLTFFSETSKWNLSKYFLKENDASAQPSPHDSHNANIKHEPNILDDNHLSSPTPSPSSTHRHEANHITPINPILPVDIKKENAAQDFNKANNNSLELQPNQIKSENFGKYA